MSGPLGGVREASLPAPADPARAAARAAEPPTAVMPAPTMDVDAARSDVTAILYALTATQRDKACAQQAQAAQRKGTERQEAFVAMQAELRKAKEAEEDSSWLGDVTGVLDSVVGALVGGNPLQDLARDLSEATGIEAFELAYDFLRPDALLNGAVTLASAATGESELQQGYDVGAGDASLKTRFEGAADATGQSEIMDAYAMTKDGMAAAMVTVGTCGVGTVAVVAIATSAALMVEAKADLLGEAGMGDQAKMWTRLGAQAALLVGTSVASLATTVKQGAAGVAAAANIVSGADHVVRGSVKVGQSIYDRDVADHMTASAKHQGAQHQADRQQQRLITGLREITSSYQRTLGAIAGTIQEHDQASLMLAHQIA